VILTAGPGGAVLLSVALLWLPVRIILFHCAGGKRPKLQGRGSWLGKRHCLPELLSGVEPLNVGDTNKCQHRWLCLQTTAWGYFDSGGEKLVFEH
jgi:hypothetical protein